MKLNEFFCCCAKVQEVFVSSATSPLFTGEVCVNEIQACASVQRTLLNVVVCERISMKIWSLSVGFVQKATSVIEVPTGIFLSVEATLSAAKHIFASLHMRTVVTQPVLSLWQGSIVANGLL